MNTSYLSKERYDEIVGEVKTLKTKGREAVADRLKQAKDLGDLSENSEYQEAREEQSRLERKINDLEELLRNATIIEKTSGAITTIKVGSKIKVEKNDEEFSYTIVGSNEARPGEGKISNESPIGKALLGKKVGDVMIIETPKGGMSYRVMHIE